MGRRRHIAGGCAGVNIVNNTIASNDTTATAGVLFNTLGAPLASSQTPGTTQTATPTRPHLSRPAW